MGSVGVAPRLALYYVALFCVIGLQLPYWPLWLAARGLGPVEIAWLIAVPSLVRVFATPLVGVWVDRRGDRRRPMLLLAGAAALAGLAFPAAFGFWPILVATVLLFVPLYGLMPVGDSLAMTLVARHRLDYGRVRLWGSLSFIAVASLLGGLLAWRPPTDLPWIQFGLLLMVVASCLFLPDARVAGRESVAPAPLGPLLRSPLFGLFLAVAALSQAAHAVYYAFGTLHWRAAGVDDATIGLLWSEGVVAEILLFAFSNRAVARFGPAGLLLLGGLGGMVRWLTLGLTTDPLWLALVQGLHAATFGCTHLGAMHFLQRAVPPALAVRAQGIYAAVAVGLVPGLATIAVGPLYQHWGGAAFLAMAALSAGAALLGGPLVRRWRRAGAGPLMGKI
ncbi:MFS transporter [Phaeospirillum tilakii]|uniref:MFS transporter n=1 Tax=Phaeospirillum tilakii TaxID=741673 RepID=A0ABW5CBU7_9PROT